MLSRMQIISAVAVVALFVTQSLNVVESSTTPSTRAAESKADENQSCHLRELDICLASVAVFTQNPTQHPINNAEINRQCKILNETETCLTNYTSRCLTTRQSEVFEMMSEGGLDIIRQLCKPSSKIRDAYLKHGNCVNGEQKAQRACIRDFQASLEKASDVQWQERLKLGCCSFNRFNSCLKDVVEPKCGKEAYEMSQQLFRATFSRLPALSCTKYQHTGKACLALLPAAGTQPKGAKSHSALSKLLSTYTGS